MRAQSKSTTITMFVLLYLLTNGNLFAKETIYHWTIPANQESPLYGPYLHDGDGYRVVFAGGVIKTLKQRVHGGKGILSSQ